MQGNPETVRNSAGASLISFLLNITCFAGCWPHVHGWVYSVMYILSRNPYFSKLPGGEEYIHIYMKIISFIEILENKTYLS